MMDFKVICRLCLEQKPRLRSIHDEHPEGSLGQLLNRIALMNVEPDDGLPQHVCRQCSGQVRRMHQIIDTYRQNEILLREQLGSEKQIPMIEIKEEEVEIEQLEEGSQHKLIVNDLFEPEVKDESSEPDNSDEFNAEYLDEDFISHEDDAGNQGDSEVPNEKKDTEQTTSDVDLLTPVKVRRKKRRSSVNMQPRRRRARTSDGEPKPKRIRKDKNPGRPRQNEHKCYVCQGTPHESAESLLAHLNDHRNMLPYTCSVCIKRTVIINDVTVMNNHLLMHRKPYKCEHCDRHYSVTAALDLHVQMAHPEKHPKLEPHFCEICGGEFPTKLVLQYHQQREHKKGYDCHTCGKSFKALQPLKRHIATVHAAPDSKKFECNICHKKLKSLEALRSHIRIMHTDQEFQCKYCPKKYSTTAAVRLHESRHENNDNYQPSKTWTEYYEEVVIPGEPPKPAGSKKFKCLLCSAVIRQVGTHMRHLHFPEKYSCDECGQEFKNKALLRIHIQEHKEGPAHKCPICAKPFSQKKNLIAHLRTKKHEGHPLTESLDWLMIGNRSGKADAEKSEVDVNEKDDYVKPKVGGVNVEYLESFKNFELRTKVQDRLNMIKVLSGVKSGTHPQAMIKIHMALFRGTLEQNSSVYNNASVTNRKLLEVVNNQCLRKVIGATKSTPRNVLVALSGQEPVGLRQEFVTTKEISRHFSRNNVVAEQLRSVRLPEDRSSWHKFSYLEQIYWQNKAILDRVQPVIRLSIRQEVDISSDLEGLTTAKQNTNPARAKQLALFIMNGRNRGRGRIYTDASKDGTKCSIGVYFETTGQRLFASLSMETSITSAELIAIKEATRIIEENSLSHSVIYTDSKASCLMLQSAQDNRYDESILIEILRTCSSYNVAIQWIPSHVSITGNEIADGLAKHGLHSDYVYENNLMLKDSIFLFKRSLNEKTDRWYSNYSTDKGKSFYYIQPAFSKVPWFFGKDMSGRDIRLLNRLMAAHEYSKYWLAKMRILDNANCDSCLTPETANHTIMECPLFNTLRRQYDFHGKYTNLQELFKSNNIEHYKEIALQALVYQTMEFDCICRLCCEEKPHMRSIFEEHPKGPLDRLLEELAQIRIETNDGLPQQVCRQCSGTVRKIQESVDAYRESDRRLRKLLLESDNPTILVEIKEEPIEPEELDTLSKNENLIVTEFQDQEVGTENSGEENLEVEYLYSEDENEHEIEITNITEDTDQSVESQQKQANSKRSSRNSKPKVRRKATKLKGTGKPGRPKTKFQDPDRPRLNDFKCYVCKGAKLGSKDSLLAHLNEHRDWLPYTCSECVRETIVIKNVTTLNNHLKMHRMPLKCQHCDRHYSDTNALDLHVQMTHPEISGKHEPHFCEVCGGEFPTRLVLLIHQRNHRLRTSCEHCGKQFSDVRNLKRHVSSIHEAVEAMHECKICSKKLKSVEALSKHLEIFHSDQQFSCKYCQKTYTSVGSLRLHESRHENNDNYQPAKRWIQYYQQITPEGTPASERKFKCLICRDILKQIGTHMRRKHFPEKHQCDQCKEVFHDKALLRVHVLEHEQGPAHRCPICGREFSLKKNLVVHMRTKKHADHPLAKSLDWLMVRKKSGSENSGITKSKSKEATEVTNQSVDGLREDQAFDGIV
ncbi:uncharacterized protein LOC129760208 [Uranotaenia lowii]|uniref:uncharacterized protein LOC129760208 n=1 Tax=Uranotaenia lowii TaxID=190385 RepID=UPI0024791887|nr:uncharacterized protein LOC129760208 [Uranotaenia lowii]